MMHGSLINTLAFSAVEYKAGKQTFCIIQLNQITSRSLKIIFMYN